MGTGHIITALSCLFVECEGLVNGGGGWGVAVNIKVHRKFHTGTRAADPQHIKISSIKKRPLYVRAQYQ